MKHYLKIFTFYFLLFTLLGCEAFVRKFTRKPKKDAISAEEIVMVPEEYEIPKMSREEEYRKYFLFWQSWHTELIESFAQARSQKKQLSCAQEALSNLIKLKTMLGEGKQQEIEAYISELRKISDAIEKNPYGISGSIVLQQTQRLRRNIMRDLSYKKIKDSLI